MKLICAAVIAFSMYSRIPMPKVEWSKENMRYLFCFFPLIGAACGALFSLWGQFGRMAVGDGNLYSAVLVLIPVLVTGGIHMDGFLDTMDALSSFRPTEEKLRILKDPHTGAFAVLGGICYFLLAFGAYSQLDMRGIRMLSAGFVLSRALSGLSVVSFPKAKDSGLAASFADASQKHVVAVVMAGYILLCFGAMLLFGGVCGVCCFLAAFAVFFYYRRMSVQKFGGITGDLAGFFLQTCELAIALTAAVAGHILSV